MHGDVIYEVIFVLVILTQTMESSYMYHEMLAVQCILYCLFSKWVIPTSMLHNAAVCTIQTDSETVLHKQKEFYD